MTELRKWAREAKLVVNDSNATPNDKLFVNEGVIDKAIDAIGALRACLIAEGVPLETVDLIVDQA